MEDDPQLAFEAGLKRAQDMGIAEADPSGDIDGYDAAVKCVCLGRALLGVQVSLDKVQPRDGIRGMQQENIAKAREEGNCRLMLVCEGSLSADGKTGSCGVRLTKVPPTSPLYT